MTERFVAIRGDVWDQTTMPARRLHLDDARALADTWRREAEACRQKGAYDQVKLWSGPAALLVIAIDSAVVQRRMMGWKDTAS